MTIKKDVLKIFFGIIFVFLFAYLSMHASESVYASTKIHLRKDAIILKAGDSYHQKLYNTKNNEISTKNISFSCDNTKIATVDSTGVIKAKKPGNTKINLEYKGKKYVCDLTVKSRFSVSKSKLTLNDYSKQKITIKKDSNVVDITYAIEDPGIIKCKLGKWNKNKASLAITPLKQGKTRIKLTYTGKGSKYDYKYITIVVKHAISVDKSELKFKDTTPQTITISTGTDIKTLSYELTNNEVISCEWGEWENDTIILTLTPLTSGSTTIKFYSEDTTDFAESVISCESGFVTQDKSTILNRMVAYGLNKAYYSAKFPSTLHLNKITYDTNKTNGNGDLIDRMVLRCYAQNGFGGYSYFYVVVLRSNSSGESSYNNEIFGYGYFSASVYGSNPGEATTIFNNKKAIEAYQYYYPTEKEISYD